MKKRIVYLMMVISSILFLVGCENKTIIERPIISEESLKTAQKYNIDLKALGIDCDVISASEKDNILTVVVFIKDMLESSEKDEDIKKLIDYCKSITDEKKFEFMPGADEDGVLFLGTSRTYRAKIDGIVYRVTLSDTLLLYDDKSLVYDDVQYRDGFKITLEKDPFQSFN